MRASQTPPDSLSPRLSLGGAHLICAPTLLHSPPVGDAGHCVLYHRTLGLYSDAAIVETVSYRLCTS